MLNDYIKKGEKVDDLEKKYQKCCEAILELYQAHRDSINGEEDRLEQCKAMLKKSSHTKGLINYILSVDAGFDTEAKLELLESYLLVNHR